MNTSDGSKVIEAFEEAEQAHVFRYWCDLNTVERERLLDQARQIDLVELKNALDQALESQLSPSLRLADLKPAPWIPLPVEPKGELRWKEAKAIGEELLYEGKVVAFTVAGGQGTRLGYNGPKGAYPVTPLTNKSLFQVFAEKLKAAHRRYGRNVDWVLMTSEINHKQTQNFFKEHNYFGLNPDGVRMVPQGMMPAVLETGEILLESKSRIAMNPDGHGGFFRVMAKSGLAKKLQDSGIEVITYFQVDNPLVPFLEPEFFGFHATAGAEMSSRATPKKDPNEKVGVFCLNKGSLAVIEYSDLPDELAQCRTSDGNLMFNAGSLAMHVISPAFAERVGGGDGACKLPYHAARKKVPTINEQGNPIVPDQPNGIKLETFVFDAVPFAKNSCVVEVVREEAFSPVKNATGIDSINTCRNDQVKQFARWAKAAGADLKIDDKGVPDCLFEVAPEFATNENEFSRRWNEIGRPSIEDGLILDENSTGAF